MTLKIVLILSGILTNQKRSYIVKRRRQNVKLLMNATKNVWNQPHLEKK